MLNRCEFIGNLGRDPEVRHTQSGRVVNFSIAVSEKWKTSAGEKKERTTWVPIVIWDEKLGEIAERYLRKGSRVYVAGGFSVRKWTGQDGQDKYSTEVVLQKFRGELTLLDGRDGGGERSDNGGRAQTPAQPSPAPTAREYGGPDFDDEIPF